MANDLPNGLKICGLLGLHILPLFVVSSVHGKRFPKWFENLRFVHILLLFIISSVDLHGKRFAKWFEILLFFSHFTTIYYFFCRSTWQTFRSMV